MSRTKYCYFAERFTKGLLNEIKSDNNPNSTQQTFGNEVGSTEIILSASEIEPIKSKLESPDVLKDRVLRILNSFTIRSKPRHSAVNDYHNLDQKSYRHENPANFQQSEP